MGISAPEKLLGKSVHIISKWNTNSRRDFNEQNTGESCVEIVSEQCCVFSLAYPKLKAEINP